MTYTMQYISPLGTITISCDEEAIIGLWFDGQRHYENIIQNEGKMSDKSQAINHPLLEKAKRWLDVYFSGQEPDFIPPLKYGSTKFRKMVCDIMLTIPYGETITYGEIAEDIARRLDIKKMSAQAVGGSVGHNPISIMIPCHRVIGTDGNLTGYGGGIERKIKLLELEKVDMAKLYVPQKTKQN